MPVVQTDPATLMQEQTRSSVDFASIIGQQAAKRALLIAAA